MTQPVNLVRHLVHGGRMRHDARAMERRWLVPLVIGGGALLLVALFVLIGGGSKTPEALDAAPTADDAATAADTTAPAWMNATYAPTNVPTITATPAPTPVPTPPPNPLIGDAVVVPAPPIDSAGTAANVPNAPSGTPLINGTQQQVAAVLQEHITALEADIAKKQAAGKTEEAEREKKSVERLKGQLDMVLDGGPP